LLILGSDRGKMPLPSDSLILRTRTRLNAAGTTVVADPIHDPDIYSFVVDIANVDDVHSCDGTIVEKSIALPSSSGVTDAEITEAINDSAIEANLRPPITLMEEVYAVIPSPIGWSPEETGLWCQDPCAGNPVVIIVVVVPCPITWCPEVALAGAQRLLVHGQSRRTESD
jgi:hypothetical protein